MMLRLFDRHYKTKKVLIEASAALVNLVSNSQDSDRSIFHSQVKQFFPTITKTVVVHIESGAIVEQVCSLIRVIAEDETNRSSLGVHGVCSFLEAALLQYTSFLV